MAHKLIKGAAARPGSGGREERLKAALKANLSRRKAQARARADGPETAQKSAPETAPKSGPENGSESRPEIENPGQAQNEAGKPADK
ncbi:MAG: hypothetical protein JKY00_07150 [Roseicyclus sp.]|nr:hypothetical protein [Roseicyclus sp.]